MDEIVEEFGSYRVRYLPRDSSRLIVAFGSAGRKAVDGTVDEFRASFWESGASLCFVRDAAVSWYSQEASRLLLSHLADLSSNYRHVGAVGHSMGGSGAIICAAHCPRVERVLAFSPQFSMAEPFIRFDDRFYRPDPQQKRHGPATFHAPEMSGRILVLYGTQDWTDLVHAGVYAVHGYDVGFVKGSDHLVPHALKSAPQGNLLIELATRFADFSAPFSFEVAKTVLGDQLSRHVSPESKFDVAAGWIDRASPAWSPRRLPPPEGLTDLTRGRATDQSSVSRWSHGSAREDSARAISREPTGGFSFHTGEEDRPWWSIDFAGDVIVRRLRIYNRIESPKTARLCVRFAIEAFDGEAWREVFRKDDPTLFGGAEGQPFDWAPPGGLATSRLRIRLLGRGCLHFDLIEIFG